MNIVMIMSGGVGKRFGASIPKQYANLKGRPIIDYVIDAVNMSKKCDKVVCVIDKQYISLSDKLLNSNIDFVDNGDTRLRSVKNGLDFIKNNYSCEKVIIVDAVAPFLYGKLIDDYFSFLDEYDCVITAQHITGALTDIDNNDYDRDKFIITQSPEGYIFDKLYNNFDVNYMYQEMAGMLGKDSKRYYNFDFKYNIKLTYDFELRYIEAMMNDNSLSAKNIMSFDKDLLYTAGLKKYLLRVERDKTTKWIDDIYNGLQNIINKYKINSFNSNQTSMYGLVIEANSETHGDVILKFIPNFIGRYYREKEAYTFLSKEYMCPIIEFNDDLNLIVEKKIVNAKYATFEDNIDLSSFFDIVTKNAIDSKNVKVDYLLDYRDELCDKINNLDKVPFQKDEISNQLNIALKLYDKNFRDSNKYIIHGDLHPFNMLNNSNKIFGIDPYGVIAPIAFEYVTFIRNDVREHKSFGYLNRFNILVDYFSNYAKKAELVAAFLVHMAFTNYNSTFEYSDDLLTKINSEIFNTIINKID